MENSYSGVRPQHSMYCTVWSYAHTASDGRAAPTYLSVGPSRSAPVSLSPHHQALECYLRRSGGSQGRSLSCSDDDHKASFRLEASGWAGFLGTPCIFCANFSINQEHLQADEYRRGLAGNQRAWDWNLGRGVHVSQWADLPGV